MRPPRSSLLVKFLHILSFHPASKEPLLQVWSLASLFLQLRSHKAVMCLCLLKGAGSHSPCSWQTTQASVAVTSLRPCTTWQPLFKGTQVKWGGKLWSSCWEVGRRPSALWSPSDDGGDAVLSQLHGQGAIPPRSPGIGKIGQSLRGHRKQVGSCSPSHGIQF